MQGEEAPTIRRHWLAHKGGSRHTAKVEAAFFDLDKTVIAKASMVAFSRPLLRAGMINRRLVLRAAWSQLVFHYLGADEERMRKFRESALRITKGWDQAKVEAVVEEALISVIEPIVYDEALAEMRSHSEAGRKVLIVSASPTEIVEPLARYLGVDEAIASRPMIDGQGRYTGEVEVYAYGPFKAEAMRKVADREGIDLDASFAYSDSITDLPMLEAVGNPVAVNPDRELARVARDRGWEIRNFRTTVPLRERVPMPAPRIAAYVAGGVAVAALAGLAWWLLRRPAASSPREQREQRRRPGRSASSYRPSIGSLPGLWRGHTKNQERKNQEQQKLEHKPHVSTRQKLADLRLLADLWRRYR